MNKQIINSNQAPAPIGPYNQCVKVGSILFISGQIPLHMESQEIEQDIQKATHLVMEYIGNILKAAHLNYSNIVKVSIFLTDMADFQLVNEIYATYFDSATAPAREAVAVKTLPKGAPIEISVIASE